MNLTTQFKSILILLSSILLTSCVAAVVAGAAAGMVYDRRSVTTLEADARLFHKIHTAIVTNPQFRNSRIEVSSFNRVILLVGQTPAASLSVLAEKIARQTPGGARVHNEITVAHPIPMTQRTRDSWITGKTRSIMLTTKGLESGSIRVVTEDATVYLMGIATQEQATLAVDVARRVNGVNKVVKIFQYIR